MAFVIYYREKNVYLKHSGNWTPYAANAMKFQTTDTVNNFMLNNFAGVVKSIPATAVDILDLDALPGSNKSGLVLDDTAASEQLEWLSDTLSDIRSHLQSLCALADYYSDKLSGVDMETTDILHKIEFTNENVVAGFHRYKQLQEVRQRRRKIKDGQDMVELLTTTGFLPSVDRLCTEMTKLEMRVQHRVYTPRVLTEMFEDKQNKTGGEENGVA